MELSLISPSPSSNAPDFRYDVFLSFRGVDTRNSFTSHLHKALDDKKIHTFIDYQLRRGDEISPSLLAAIEESKISIIVFSKGYASSRWCLEELVKILQCKNIFGQIVIPIFYEVDPSHVRNQTGSFIAAFTKHEERYKESLARVQTWKDALKEAASLSGWDSSVTKPESQLIKDIVEDVLRRLDATSSNDNSHLIGINSKIREIELLLNTESSIVGIWGIGGIGKTTLAGVVFEKVSCQFEGSCFIQNVREASKQGRGLDGLRKGLISELLGDHGSSFAKKRLARMKLLIVLDDVTDVRQMEYLIGHYDCLGSGSRIIITSRDQQVLKSCGAGLIYEVLELSFHDALQLFCMYAFHQNHPKVDYEELSESVIKYVGGVPLALKVLGSSLLGKSKEVWMSAMEKLENNLEKDIHEVLKISYKGLDDNEQSIFLDIACFFVSWDVNLVKAFMDASGFFTEIGISILIDKSLISISNNMLRMHDLLQAMGKEIVRQKSAKDPSRLSRLWHHKDIFDILTNDMGSQTIEGVSLDMSKQAIST